MSTITVRKAAEKLPELSRAFAEHRKSGPIKVTDAGEATMVIMSLEEYESLVETAEVCADRDLMSALRRSAEDVKQGRTRSLEEADAILDW